MLVSVACFKPGGVFLLSDLQAFTVSFLVQYRATLSSREDDQIFIDVAEQHHLEEQTEVIARMTRLRKPIIVLTAISAVLFLSGVSFWLYEGLKKLLTWRCPGGTYGYSDGLALRDECSDAICACICEPFDGNIEIMSAMSLERSAG
jgi:hypothetical protein